jgi:D-sedoheptulose 7-phosphate isomerase
MKHWISDYLSAQKAAHDSIPVSAVAELIGKLRAAVRADRQIFVFGNGGSAANASHFATDLGKGASDKVGRRFRVLALCGATAKLRPAGGHRAGHQRQRQFT